MFQKLENGEKKATSRLGIRNIKKGLLRATMVDSESVSKMVCVTNVVENHFQKLLQKMPT